MRNSTEVTRIVNETVIRVIDLTSDPLPDAKVIKRRVWKQLSTMGTTSLTVIQGASGAAIRASRDTSIKALNRSQDASIRALNRSHVRCVEGVGQLARATSRHLPMRLRDVIDDGIGAS